MTCVYDDDIDDGVINDQTRFLLKGKEWMCFVIRERWQWWFGKLKGESWQDLDSRYDLDLIISHGTEQQDIISNLHLGFNKQN